jgi:hypothetical protein
MVGRLVANNVEQWNACAPGVVKVGKAIRQPGAAMQERCSGLSRDARITICRARCYAFEQREYTAYPWNAVESGNEMHLARPWIGEAHVDPTTYQGTYQTFGTVHENAPETPKSKEDMLFRRVSPLPVSDAPSPEYPGAVPNVFEHAPSGRSKCRGCGRAIERGELRFGERVPNLFAEGETTLWFHPVCAAYKRPQPLIDTLQTTTEAVPEQENLERAASATLAHPRIERIDGAEKSPSGQAKCRHCREPIEKGSWRIRIVYYEEGRFSPGGYVHLACRKDYFDTDELRDAILQFSPALSTFEREELTRALAH